MSPSPLVRAWIFLCALYPALVAAETLSPQGSPLRELTIDVQNAHVQKEIDASEGIAASLVVASLPGNVFVQLTPSGFVQWNGDIGTLRDAGFRPQNGKLNFTLVSGADLSGIPLPITVYLGVFDTQGALKFGWFTIRGQDTTPSTGLQAVSDEVWDNAAVRRVLHAFAFGGFARDAQIQAWADMPPAQAIEEILTVGKTNNKLSPQDSDKLGSNGGTLAETAAFWASSSGDNPVARTDRANYKLTNYRSAERTWREMVNRRGLNPVRQKIGMWETNYHLSVNLDARVTNLQVVRYYDDILNALAQNQPYQDVIATAALSAAVATQYNHRKNVFKDGLFRGNEDFGREYHQIFFGVMGDYDPLYHEEISVKNTAMALTDMDVDYVDGNLADVCTFDTKEHYPGSLSILNVTVDGATAVEKIAALAQTSIQHPESLANLPVIIARGLGDDHLTEEKQQALRAAWAAMPEKNLLTFLRQYAISTLFHDASRVKYYDSMHRHLTMTNLMTLNNDESYRELYLLGLYKDEGTEVFRPIHDVFGGQTGLEASEDPNIFREVYNRTMERSYQYTKVAVEEGKNTVWEKDWGSIAPQEADGTYLTRTVADWLWQRFVADGGKNFGPLEKFHLYALLGTGVDAGYQLDPDNPEKVYSSADLSDRILQTKYEQWGDLRLKLASDDAEERQQANYQVSQAVNFIVASPFVFAQEGR